MEHNQDLSATECGSSSRALHASWVPPFVLLVSIVLTVVATYYAAISGRARDRQRFGSAVERTLDNIEDRLESYVVLLRGVAGLFVGGENVDQARFQAYARRLRFQDHCPDIQGIGFSMRVKPDQRGGPAADAPRPGLEAVRAGPGYTRSEYHCIVYLEPQDQRNRGIAGLDLYAELACRGAMEQARDQGIASVSSRITRVQNGAQQRKQQSVVLFVPVYHGDAVPPTVAQRRAQLAGFVFGIVDTEQLPRGILRTVSQPGVEFDLFDGNDATEAHLLHRLIRSGNDQQPSFAAIRSLEVPWCTWTLKLATTPTFDLEASRELPPVFFACGVAVSSILFLATRSLARARMAAEQLAGQLLQSQQALQASEARARDLVVQEQRARRGAEQANRMKDEFLATVSHELRTPLNAMLGWSQLLLSGGLDAATHDEALESIERNAKAQAKLIEDLLDLSRIVRGKLRLEIQQVYLGPVIEGAVAAVLPAAAAKRIQIHRTLDGATGPIRGDGTRLQQVVWNLLTNAVKFTPDGGRVDVELRQEDGSALVRVRDSGIGISPAFLPHVFDPFRQDDSSTTRRYGGLGLGLAIVHRLVELHGGSISVQSPGPGCGASFTVRLPLAPGRTPAITNGTDQPSGAQPPSARAGRASGAAVSLAGLRVLVVDDEPDARRLLSTVLGAQRVEVEVAASAIEAFRAYQRRRPDVLLSDIGMPEEDGYALMRRIRRHEQEQGAQHMPAAALTAFASAADRAQVLAAGFELHVPKPVEPEALLHVVAQLAGREVPPGGRQ